MSGGTQSGLDAIDDVFGRSLAEGEAPGVVAGVILHGRLSRAFAGGFADVERAVPFGVDTPCRIASVTKHFTALGVLRLRDEGRLRLDDPLAEHVPETRALEPPTRDSRAVTIRDLLTHTAGFVNDDPWADRRLGITPGELNALLAGGGLFARPPGLGFEYSNLGYALLGRVLGNVGGGTYRDVLGGRLFAPLGLTRTGFDFEKADPTRRALPYLRHLHGWAPERIEADGEFGAMGGLFTTAEDFARWAAFILDAWPARDDPDDGAVRRASVRELGQTHGPPVPAEVLANDGEARASAYGYGLMSTVDPVLGRVLQHAGGLPGYGAHVIYAPEAELGVFAFANSTYAPMPKRVWEAARALHAAGAWVVRDHSTDERWLRAVRAAGAIYTAGLAASPAPFAENLLLDESREDRETEILALRARFGRALTFRPEPRHALGGRVVLVCERGQLPVDIALAPGPDGAIQTLRFASPSELAP